MTPEAATLAEKIYGEQSDPPEIERKDGPIEVHPGIPIATVTIVNAAREVVSAWEGVRTVLNAIHPRADLSPAIALVQWKSLLVQLLATQTAIDKLREEIQRGNGNDRG